MRTLWVSKHRRRLVLRLLKRNPVGFARMLARTVKLTREARRRARDARA